MYTVNVSVSVSVGVNIVISASISRMADRCRCQRRFSVPVSAPACSSRLLLLDTYDFYCVGQWAVNSAVFSAVTDLTEGKLNIYT